MYTQKSGALGELFETQLRLGYYFGTGKNDHEGKNSPTIRHHFLKLFLKGTIFAPVFLGILSNKTSGEKAEYAKFFGPLPDILSGEQAALRRTFWSLAGHL